MKTKNTILLAVILVTLHSTLSIASGPWTSLNGPYGYFSPQTIIHHQGAVYVTSNVNSNTGTGVWKSVNAGTSWVDVSAGLPKPYARDLESVGNDIFAACDTGVFRSSNQGITWIAADSLLPIYALVYDLVAHQNELYAAVYQGTGATDLYKTGNNGLTWTYTGYSFSISVSLNHLFSSGNTLWASTTAGVYKSTDGGATFNYAGNNIPFSASINSIAAKGDTAYCGTSNGSYFTSDGGQMWTPYTIATLPSPLYTYCWEISGNTIYAGLNNGGVYFSPLGQTNFTAAGTGFQNYNFPWMLANDGTYLYAATSEGIFSYPLTGGTWSDKNGTLTRARATVAFADNNLVLSGSGYFSGLKRTTNGGVSWTNTSINNQQGIFRRALKINNTLLMPSTYSMHTSTDDGLTWTNLTVAPIAYNALEKYGNYLIAGAGNNVAFSNNLGQSWNLYSSGIPANGTVYSLAVKGKSAFAGVNSSIYRMETPGATWLNFSQGIPGNGSARNVLSVGTTLLCNNTFGLFRRTEEDSIWRNIQFNSTFYDIIEANGYLFAAAYDGVQFSDDLGKSFHPYNEGFPPYLGEVEDLFFDGSQLYAGTRQFSAWKRTVSPEISITSLVFSPICTGMNLSVQAQCATPLNTGNTYYLQLSDPFGRFLNPIVLDSVNSNASTVILSGLLPDSLPTGTAYRTRIVSSSPYLLVTDNGYDFSILQSAKIILQPANQNVCQGEGSGFYINATGDNLSYQWQVDQNGSGNYTNLSNNLTYQQVNSPLLLILNPLPAMNGYRYRCTLSNSCGILNSNYGTLTVNSITNNITMQPLSSTVCNGLPVQFNVAASGTGLSYQWQVNSGFGLFTNINNNSQYSGANTATLSLNFTSTAQNGFEYRCKIGACLYSDTALLTVNGEPVFLSSLLPQQYCDGGSVQFSAAAQGAGISYQWEVDNGSGYTNIINNTNYSGAQTANLLLQNIPSSFNNYQYRCVLSGQCAPFSSTTNAAAIQLTAAPALLVQPLDFSTCQGDTATFSVLGSGNFLYYNWELNNGNGWVPIAPIAPFTGVNSSTLKIDTVTTSLQNYQFRCKLSGCIQSDSASLTVFPVPSVSASELSICNSLLPYTMQSGLPPGGTYYGTGIYNGTFNPSALSGTYAYEYVYQSPLGCNASAKANIAIEVCTGTAPLLSTEASFSLYPNPAGNSLMVSFLLPAEEIKQLRIFTLQGQLIYSSAVPAGTLHSNVDVTPFPSGLYFLQVLSTSRSESARVIVIH